MKDFIVVDATLWERLGGAGGSFVLLLSRYSSTISG